MKSSSTVLRTSAVSIPNSIEINALALSSPKEKTAFCQTHDQHSLDDMNPHIPSIYSEIFAIFM